jgi:hypothetical protein
MHTAVRHLPSTRHLLIVSLLLALLAALLLLPAQAAQAALRGCRADPVFVLSDGTILDVQVSIGTDVSNVDGIHYVVHGPRGTRLVTSISTPTLGFKGLETVRYVADRAPNQYVTDTLVTTREANVSASSYTIFAGNNLTLAQILRLRLLNLQYHVIEGQAGEHLIAYLQK